MTIAQLALAGAAVRARAAPIHSDAEVELGDAATSYATHASGLIAAAFLAEFERVRDLLPNASRVRSCA